MTQEQVNQAFNLCTKKDYPEWFCPCDHCPMMEAGCNEFRDDEFVTIPRALVEEMQKLIDPAKSEFTHVRYLN